MKHRLILVFLLICSCKVFGQSETDTADFTTDGLYLQMPLELPQINVNNLNQRLNNYSYPNCDIPKVAFGIGFLMQLEKILIMYAHNGATNSTQNANGNADIDYKSNAWDIGWDFLNNPHWSLFPYLGYKSSDITYTYRDNGNFSFNNYLTNNIKEKQMTNSMANIDIGLGLSCQSFFQLGVKAGFFLPIEKESWNIYNNKSSLSDFLSIQRNFYISVFVGIGFIERSKNNGNKTLGNFI